MYSEPIPLDHNPKYLGVILDRRLSFNRHTEVIRQKCFKLLNILKCLAYKTWALNLNQQLTIYKCLIRSCMEYASPLLILSDHNIKLLQGIQYQALRIIYKAPFMASSKELHSKANLETVHIRLLNLSKNYVIRVTKSENPLFAKLTGSSAAPSGPLSVIQSFVNSLPKS